MVSVGSGELAHLAHHLGAPVSVADQVRDQRPADQLRPWFWTGGVSGGRTAVT
jgi:hypothetical protein